MNFMMKNDRTLAMNLYLRVDRLILSVVLFCIRKQRKNLSIDINTDDMYLTTSADIVETFGSSGCA